ncbi:MAG: immunogenic protein [Candidatus Magnetoglobus multicellularis str. Araruama]|uniref:Immunogenic protein n=1 Tax=Candidatus Magnetoglobus multicellularis str. Araruama TaxID=890399 RepID=A0A1V1P9D5_9BACT|nr:MAG: immunogenic protein [Candidatus Magnetoglobus multicellularis str. Araruama]
MVPGTVNPTKPVKADSPTHYDKKLIDTESKVNLTLGTASESGVFYPVGRGISKMVNDRKTKYGLRFITYSTSGSKYNLQAIRNGELDFAISRFDLAYEAYRGIGNFDKHEPITGLRYIATLYPMPIGVIVHKKSEIHSLNELKGKRINIGNPGSGKRSVANMIFSAMEWKNSDFERVTGLATREMGNIFCSGGVDAIIELLGVPASFYDRITRDCMGRFIPIPSDVVLRVQRDNPFIEHGDILGGVYPHNPKTVATFQIGAILLTSRRLSGDVVFQVCQTIFKNIEEFKKIHPALLMFNLNNIKKEETFIPYHNGALKYYREQGLTM